MSWETGGYSWDEDQALWDAEERSKTTGLSSALRQMQSLSISASAVFAKTQTLETLLEGVIQKTQTAEVLSDTALQIMKEIEMSVDALLSRDTDKRLSANAVLLKVMFLSVLLESSLNFSGLHIESMGDDRIVTSGPLRFHADGDTQPNLSSPVKRGDSSHEIGLRFASEVCETFRFWFTENNSWVHEVAGFFNLSTEERAPTTVDNSGVTYDPFSEASEDMPFVASKDNFLYLVAVVEPDASPGTKDFASLYISFDEVA